MDRKTDADSSEHAQHMGNLRVSHPAFVLLENFVEPCVQVAFDLPVVPFEFPELCGRHDIHGPAANQIFGLVADFPVGVLHTPGQFADLFGGFLAVLNGPRGKKPARSAGFHSF